MIAIIELVQPNRGGVRPPITGDPQKAKPLFRNKPIFRKSLGGVSGRYDFKRNRDRLMQKGIDNLRKKLISQAQNPMQNV